MLQQIQNQEQDDPFCQQDFCLTSKLSAILEQTLQSKAKFESSDAESLILNHLSQQKQTSAEKESGKKLADPKLKYKKIKQKLSILSEQIQDQGMMKEQKDLTSPNKSRLMKLSLELQKAIKTQAVDYAAVESLLKQIQKIVEHKRQHDVLILKGARVMMTLLYFVKRFPSLHKTEAFQSMTAMQQSLKLLHIILSLSVSRQQILASNQLVVLVSLLNCGLMRQDKKISLSCLQLLSLVISSPMKIEYEPLLHTNIEYILCSSLIRKLKTFLQSCLDQDDSSNCQLLLIGFRFFYLLTSIACAKQYERPMYKRLENSDTLAKSISLYFEVGLQLMIRTMIDLLFERQSDQSQEWILRDEQIPSFKINVLLYILRAVNIICHVDYQMAQTNIQFSCQFTKCLLFIFEYSKQYFKQSHELRAICSEIMVLLGNLGFQNTSNQDTVRNQKLLEAFCNHPIQYLMENSLKNIIIPSYCCLIFNNTENCRKAFEENSSQPVLQYLLKEIKNRKERVNQDQPIIELGLNLGKQTHCQTLSRQTSVSSITSKASIAESLSTQASNHFSVNTGLYNKLQHRFRPQNWELLANVLRTIDD